MNKQDITNVLNDIKEIYILNEPEENKQTDRRKHIIECLAAAVRLVEERPDFDIEEEVQPTSEWEVLKNSGVTRFQCKRCRDTFNKKSIFTLAYKCCPECGARITNNIKQIIYTYNPETGRNERIKKDAY